MRADTGSFCGRALETGRLIVVPDMDEFNSDHEDVEAYRRSEPLSVYSAYEQWFLQHCRLGRKLHLTAKSYFTRFAAQDRTSQRLAS